MLAAAGAAPPAASAATARYAAVSLRLPASAGPRVLAPVRAPFAFDLVGARWRADGAVAAELRVRGETGPWSAWHPLEPTDPEPAEERGAGVRRAEPLWTPASRSVQIRTRGRGRLLALRVAFVNGSAGPAVDGVRPLAGLVTSQPAIVTRAQWGADESIRRADPLYAPSVSAVVIHHTATPNGYSATEAPAVVRSIYAYHVRSNGWNDVGYNFLVDAYGRVYEGRYGGIARNVIAAHTLGFNTGTVGIAYIGNGDQAGLTAAARQAIVQLVSWRLDLAHVDPAGRATLVSGGNPKFPAGRSVTLGVVSGHRDLYPTDCPGSRISPDLAGIAAEAAATGLPKIFAPVAAPARLAVGANGVIAPITFTATLAGATSWTVRLLDRTGATIQLASGLAPTLRWTWDGRRADGSYARAGDVAGWRIEAAAATGTTALPATGSFDGSTPPAVVPPVAPAPGPLAVAAAPASISPNADGVDDTATIRYHLDAPAIASVSVLDRSGALVTTPQPPTSLPAGDRTLTWNAVGPDGVNPVPDGQYQLLVQSTDASGRAQAGVAPVSITRVVAALRLGRSVASPNGDGRYDRVPISWRQDAAIPTTVELRRGLRLVARLYAGTPASGPAGLVWDGRTPGRLTSGTYQVVVRAETGGGPQTLSQPLTIDVSPPRIRAAVLRTARSGGSLRLVLSEAAMVRVGTSGRTLVPFRPRRPGLNGFRWQSHGGRQKAVLVYAWDTAGNRMPPALVRVSRRPGH